MLRAFGHPVATCCDMLYVKLLAQVSKWSKLSQQHSTVTTRFTFYVSHFLGVGGGFIIVRPNESVVLYFRVISKVISKNFSWLE